MSAIRRPKQEYHEQTTRRMERHLPSPFDARPRRLSVTEIEDLLRDPYTIYARHVLGLRPLDEIDEELGAAARGTIIHDAIGAFGKAFPGKLPDDTAHRLTEIGAELFAPLAA